MDLIQRKVQSSEKTESEDQRSIVLRSNSTLMIYVALVYAPVFLVFLYSYLNDEQKQKVREFFFGSQKQT